MPWVKFGNNIRNFDLPMSLQTNEALEYYEDKYNKFQQMQSDLTHTNHYSNAPYIIFYVLVNYSLLQVNMSFLSIMRNL